jgi:hypothetical protein
MVPVTSFGTDVPVPQTGQLIADVLTTVIAASSVAATLVFCVRHRIWWPMLIVVSGTMTFLLEPMFDHFYGLWFYTPGQQNAVTTYGIHVPMWLPIIYIAYYGCGTVWYWNKIQQGADMRAILKYFGISVLLAGICEEFYINFVGLYGYQDHQPFVVFNYPVYVVVVNGVPPMLAALLLYGLLPRLKGLEKLCLLFLVPVSFAANSFGTGWLYLAARHLQQTPSMPVLSALALLTSIGSVGIIWAAAKLVRAGEGAIDTAAAVGVSRETRPSYSHAA